MNKKLLLIPFAPLALGLGGCATVLNGTNTDYRAETLPEGADISFANGMQCSSPCEIELKRKADTRVDIALDGYKPTYVLVQSKLAGNTFGNILLGGAIGGIVDGTNGASNKLSPDRLFVKLALEGTDEEPVLLDEDGKVWKTVQEHNDAVRLDVAKTIGPKLAGLE